MPLTIASPTAGVLQLIGAVVVGTLDANGIFTQLTSGIDYKGSVRVATTVAGTLATSFENGDTVDGIVLATGDRILIKNQASAPANGIYVVAASGAPTRASDFDAWGEIPGAVTGVEEGTANADTVWICTSNQGGTLGVTDIVFAQFGAATDLHSPTAIGDVAPNTIAGTTITATTEFRNPVGGYLARSTTPNGDAGLTWLDNNGGLRLLNNAGFSTFRLDGSVARFNDSTTGTLCLDAAARTLSNEAGVAQITWTGTTITITSGTVLKLGNSYVGGVNATLIAAVDRTITVTDKDGVSIKLVGFAA